MSKKEWSKELQKATREKLMSYPIAHVKNIDGRFGISMPIDDGHISITLMGENHKPSEVSEDYSSMDDLIAAGWALD